MMFVDTSPRDQRIMELVAAFGQLAGGQLARLVFHERKSHSSRDRVLRRLVGSDLLAYVDRRQVGGWRSGSAQHVYQLGRKAWPLHHEGRYYLARSIDRHGLGIADVFVALVEAERTGKLRMTDFVTEPACHEDIGHISLTPDARFDVETSAGHVSYWLELDMGTERAPQLADKCRRYWHAVRSDRTKHPLVLFVVPDAERISFIQRVVEGGPDEAQGLFRVTELSGLIEMILEH